MSYNFRNMEKVQETEICCPFCLTEELLDAFQHLREYECIDLIADAEIVTEVLRVLLNSEVDGNQFTLGMVDIDGAGDDYFGEYVLTINDDMSIWIEPAWREHDGKADLFDTDAYITYLHGDCDSKILQRLNKNKLNVMIFDFEGEEE